jgi:hypothetical protein
MQGKKLTKEEKKDRCNYCLSKVLKLNLIDILLKLEIGN